MLENINVADNNDDPEFVFSLPPEYVHTTAATSSVVTVLTSVVSQANPQGAPSLNKRYYLDANTGKLALENYQNGYRFKVEEKPVNCINELASLLSDISRDDSKMIIRGLQVSKKTAIKRRTNDNFAEHPEGTFFVMLDFDKVETDHDPLTVDAIESVITKLPAEFQNATYYYQHSNSAGILNDEGQPFKQGLNAHVFFWLNRRVLGPALTAYLKKHCLDTGFHTVGEGSGGSVRITYGIDPAPIFSAVQAHYTASPTIEAGVQCNLKPENRQGLVTKNMTVVKLPTFSENIAAEAYKLGNDIKRKYEKEHGFKTKQSQTRTSNGIATVTYSVNPNVASRGNRTLKAAKPSNDGKYLTLYFEGENSPGSWFVSLQNPQIAKRYGDGERMPLKELSTSAYAYVRDELKWFTELPHHQLSLVNGYLPRIDSFASAKVSLILAPTGSGKSTAAIDWIKSKSQVGQLIIYAAPTIALVNQMQADIIAAGIPCANYTEVYKSNLIETGVILTTNKSLKRILRLNYDVMRPHYFICDEIHAGFDEFMSSSWNNDFFEQALLKSKQTLLLTGTLTDVQKLGLPNVIGHALSSLSEQDYCCYEFDPIKSNPLSVKPLSDFEADFILLMADFVKKIEQGAVLPRAVILPATSKMDAYRAILSEMGLSDYAHVISRPENLQEDIDEARVSDLPILIASPVFGVGVNLHAEPDILWARFDRLNADSNQVTQTVNRANRGQVRRCNVRIYGNISSDSKIKLPNRLKLKHDVAQRLRLESSFAGLLEEHLQIDRNTYLSLRSIEKNSDRTLSYLYEHNLIQNYTIDKSAMIGLTNAETKEKNRAGKMFKTYYYDALDQYINAVSLQADRFAQAESYYCFWILEKLAEERKYAKYIIQPRVEREIKTEETGVLMALCDLAMPQQGEKVEKAKIKRIFGEIVPWLSAQYDPEKSPNWAQVQAEKTECIVVLLNKLAEIQSGSVSVSKLVESLSRNKRFCDAFLALASHDQEYLAISKKLTGYISRCKSVRSSGSDKDKVSLKSNGNKLLAELVEPIGVFFERVDDEESLAKAKELAEFGIFIRVQKRINYNKLIVPVKWDLTALANNLTKQALRLKALPVSQKVPVLAVDDTIDRKPMCVDVCEKCTMYHKMECVLGYPVDAFDALLPRSRVTKCSDFKVIKIKLVA